MSGIPRGLTGWRWGGCAAPARDAGWRRVDSRTPLAEPGARLPCSKRGRHAWSCRLCGVLRQRGWWAAPPQE